MSDATIHCPHCTGEIKLTESLAAPMLAASRTEFEKRLREKDAQVLQRESELQAREQSILQQQAKLQEQVASQVQARWQSERAQLIAQESQRLKAENAAQTQAAQEQAAQLQERLATQEAKLAQAQKTEAEFLKSQRALEDERRELELTVEKRVQENLASVKARAKSEAEEAIKLQLTERELTIASMQQKIAELKQKAEQGSQQLQGEALELNLEQRLREQFMHDNIEPVAKGELGADLRHLVLAPSGQQCGTLLWEIKRTKAWSNDWIPKLKDDLRRDRADIAILVTQTLPKGIETFGLQDGVWVCSLSHALALGMVLRQGVQQVHTARQLAQNQGSKQELVYQYLTGTQFKQRIESLVETFSSLHEDLQKERTAISRQWAKRQTQIDKLMLATTGMYGDLQGIAGKALEQIDGLGLEALE